MDLKQHKNLVDNITYKLYNATEGNRWMDILALIESCNIEVSEEFLSEFLYIVNSSGSKEQILREFVRYLTLLSKNSLQTLCSENKHFEKFVDIDSHNVVYDRGSGV